MFSDNEYTPAITKKQLALKTSIQNFVKESGILCAAHGTLKDEFSLNNQDLKMYINILLEEQAAVAFSNRVMDYDVFSECRECVLRLIDEKGMLELNDFRDAMNVTRNIAVDILDKFDSIGVTQRMEGHRILGTAVKNR